MGWLLVLSLKEGLVECAAVCVKSVVILVHFVNTILENITYFTSQQGHINWQKDYDYTILDDFYTYFHYFRVQL